MYWNFYLILTKVFALIPLLFWIFHFIIAFLSVKLPRKPGTICFLIPGILFAFHDIRWEALDGPFNYNLFFLIIEIGLMVLGSIFIIMGSTGISKLINLLIAFMQGYAFGVICIFALVWFIGSISVLVVCLILAFFISAIISIK